MTWHHLRNSEYLRLFFTLFVGLFVCLFVWLVGWLVLRHINLILFYTEVSLFMQTIILFQVNSFLMIICQQTTIVYRLIGLVGRVFANGPGDLGSIPGCVIPKTLKMVLDTSLLNTQWYEVRIKGKVEQSRERSSVLLYTSV